MIEKDYEKFDYMKALVNEDYLGEVLTSYESFGWHVEEEEEDRIFSNTKSVTLSREHNIVEKDKLQLLQVYMENEYSNISKFAKKRYLKSTVLGSSVGLIAAALICFFVFFALNASSTLQLVLSWVMVGFGVCVLVVMFFAMAKIKKIEDNEFASKCKMIRKNIANLCGQAKSILEK